MVVVPDCAGFLIVDIAIGTHSARMIGLAVLGVWFPGFTGFGETIAEPGQRISIAVIPYMGPVGMNDYSVFRGAVGCIGDVRHLRCINCSGMGGGWRRAAQCRVNADHMLRGEAVGPGDTGRSPLRINDRRSGKRIGTGSAGWRGGTYKAVAPRGSSLDFCRITGRHGGVSSGPAREKKTHVMIELAGINVIVILTGKHRRVWIYLQ